MLHRLRSRRGAAPGLSIEYRCADYLTFESEQRFDLIMLIMSTTARLPSAA